MDKFFKFITDQTLAKPGQTDKFLLAGLGVVAAFFLLNVILNPYTRHNSKARKANKLLVRSIQTRRSVPVGKLRLPLEYYDGFQNYRNSQSRFPSEFISFRERKHRPVLEITMAVYLIAAIGAAVANGAKFGFSEVTIALFFATPIAYLVARGLLGFVFRMKTAIAVACYKRFGRSLDIAFGEKYFSGAAGNSVLSEACLDSDIDDTVAKIEFLKANGVSPSTAREVAALLSNERLNKPRTQEQQRKLNAALNGLLQTLSVSAQKQNIPKSGPASL